MPLRTALRLLTAVVFAAVPASAFAQDQPVILTNPLDGLLPGGGDGANNTRRIDNSKIARRIIDSGKAGNGWTVVEVQSIDKADGSSIVR